jgi:V/A-type H+-transporting ATPase subunit A
METRERIGRFKYTPEQQVDEEYEKVLRELAQEFADVTAREEE